MIDLIIVNYKTAEDLHRCGESIIAANLVVPYDVTVVNVEPEEADLAAADRLGFRTFNFESNIGYARACNYAASETSNPYLAFFNADTRLAPYVVERCVDVLSSDPEYGIAGPRQVDERGRITHAGIFGTLKHPKHRAWNRPDSLEYGDLREAVTVSGSAYFVKRSVWNELTECKLYREVVPEALGAFLPTQHYYEETWCSYHAQAHGYKVMYVGTAKMVHLWHRASKVGGPAEKMMSISRQLFRKACDLHDIPHD